MNTKAIREMLDYIDRANSTLEKLDDSTSKLAEVIEFNIIKKKEQIKEELDREENEDGGAGSGNWGHVGIPGHWGGSLPGGGKGFRMTDTRKKEATSQAKKRDAAKARLKKARDKYAPDENGKFKCKSHELEYKRAQKAYDKLNIGRKSARKLIASGKYDPNASKNAQTGDIIKKGGVEGYANAVNNTITKGVKQAGFRYPGEGEPKIMSGKPMDEPPAGSIKSIDECKNAGDVQRLIKDSGFVKENGRGVDLRGMDLDTAKNVYHSFNDVCQKFPELKGTFEGIAPEYMPPNVYAACYRRDGFITYNPTHFASQGKLEKMYQQDVNAGFHPPKTDASAIITHEMGHAIDGTISRAKGERLNGLASQEAMKYVAGKVGKTEKEVQQAISRYAESNYNESFAEGFAEGMHSPAPRAEAKAYMEWIAGEVKKLKKN